MTISATQVTRFRNVLPFWMPLGLIPLIVFVAMQGGWWLILVPLSSWWLFSVLDRLTGLNLENPDPDTPEEQLFWYRLILLIWFPMQFCVIFGLIIYVGQTDHLSVLEQVVLFLFVGIISGAIGINYGHELMHQKSLVERWLADLLLATVMYSHFRSEHLLVHHRYVGTKRDPVTARYDEGFWYFFPRVLRESLISAFRAEAAMLARKGLPWHHRSNPFWFYAALQGAFLVLAFVLGGIAGLVLFLCQALSAIWKLELANYIEHYGLTRKHLGAGKYEHVKPHHSWNAAHKATNWLLINLQRHSDHHYKPNRRFPLLQNYTEADAPQLPHGYPVMAAATMAPPLWRRVMNPRVRKWRQLYYPEITDWQPYNKVMHPAPR